MGCRIKDKYYQNIEKRIEKGEFIRGNDCTFNKYYFEKNIHDFMYYERTSEVCSSLMDYSKCELKDVPLSSRTRDFYINSYFDKEVKEYIKNNLNEFDREFFKDLIRTNSAATWSDKNCFEFMPLEYIDEEMCNLAIIESTNYIAYNWFFAVLKRKPIVLTQDLWNLAARLYSRETSGFNNFLDKTPKQFRTKDYYISMCKCNFNEGMSLYTNKGKIMDTIPKEIITEEFLIELLSDSLENIAMFSEEALETLIPNILKHDGTKEKLWKIIIKIDGSLIKYIPLNEERIKYFLSLYDKDSTEYIWSFKDKYKKYLNKKNNYNKTVEKEERIKENTINLSNKILLNAILYGMEGIDPIKAVEDVTKRNNKLDNTLLPIKYKGLVPDELKKEYDSEEYLLLMYDMLCIKVIEEYDNYFYKVTLPTNLKIERNGYWNSVLDDKGNKILEFFYDSKFYDKDAYVKEIFVPSTLNKTLKKENK